MGRRSRRPPRIAREPDPVQRAASEIGGLPVDLGDRVDLRALLGAPWTLCRDLSGAELDDAYVSWAADAFPASVYPPDEVRARHERRHQPPT